MARVSSPSRRFLEGRKVGELARAFPLAGYDIAENCPYAHCERADRRDWQAGFRTGQAG